MNRNTMSRWSTAFSGVTTKRSRFDRSSSHKTSFSVGSIVPFYLDECLPGDTFDISTAKVVRMQPMVAPPMDDLFLDTFYFFVPMRLVWDNWQEFQGESTSAWTPSVERSIPQINFPASTGWIAGTIADYFGVPTNVVPAGTGAVHKSINALPFRAFCKIYNDWFRDENLEDEVYFLTDDTTITGNNGYTILTDLAKGGYPPKAHKFRDYFTACLPAPQKHADVMLPALDFRAPVYAEPDLHTPNPFFDPTHNPPGPYYPLTFGNENSSGSMTSSTFRQFWLEEAYNNGTTTTKSESGSFVVGGTTPNAPSNLSAASGTNGSIYAAPLNLWSRITQMPTYSINQLRLAFAIQKAYEVDSRCGSRYVEAIKARWGITSPDFRVQRSEYLGGNRITIQVNQVLQTSSTDSVSPQGNPTGLSVTHDNNKDFTKSFTEHGYIIGVMVARYNHTYQQGLERLWNRKSRFDFYEPIFANIGEQPVLNKEIYLSNSAQTNDEVFGYNEAWADYRYKPSRVSGEMRSNHAISLDSWHFADYYANLPSLSAAWSREDPSNVDRCLTIQSTVSNQLWADIYIQNYTTRVMPVYSIPGLIDHA